MFSGASFSEFGFSEHDYEPLDDSDFQAFLAEIASARCWLLEIDAFALAEVGGVSGAFSDSAFGQVGFADTVSQATLGEVTLRFGTHAYTSQAADSPANTFYAPRLLAPPYVNRQIVGRDGIGGLTAMEGEVRLNNADGGLDLVLRDYAIDGRRARVLVGRLTDPLSAYGVVFTGVAVLARVGKTEMTVQLSDGSKKLERLVNETVYAGTGGLEGDDDLKGKCKPVAVGYSWNVAPPLVDSARLIYQVHNGQVNDVPDVYDRGVALTQGSDYASEADMNATAPSAGQYRVYKTGGYFRLGSTPDGTVTADVEGDASPSFVTNAADIVQRLLVDAGLSGTEINPTSFVNLAAAASANTGDWAGTDPVTVGEFADRLLAGVGAFGGFSRHGAFSVGRVALPESEVESATIESVDVIDIEREPLPAAVEPIAWRVAVGWQRNPTVQTDLADAVSAARRTFAAEPLRLSVTEDANIQSRHKLATELIVESNFALEADADTERDRLVALWSRERAPFRVRTVYKHLTRELGDVVRLKHSRFGLADAGVAARVLGHTVDGAAIELRVLA